MKEAGEADSLSAVIIWNDKSMTVLTVRKNFQPWQLGLILFLVTFLSACSGVLPKREEETKSPWASYEEAKASFDQLEVGKSRIEDIGKLGYDPKTVPNITRITYIDLLTKFLPNQSISLDDLDPALSKCLQAREACYGLSLKPGVLDDDRFGNAFMDVFGFRRNTRTTGWRFEALVVIHDDLVVYKLAGGESNIDSVRSIRRPLGPIQELDLRIPVAL